MALNRKDISTAARGVSLEHRHFSFIAATLKDQKPSGAITSDADKAACMQWEVMVRHFADACRSTNTRFDRARFLSACGLEA